MAAAKAILEYLNRGDNIVIVATHDIELVNLLGRRYECYHFREIIHHQQMEFDYRIQPGTSSTRNAIAILNLVGYPKTIVAEALDVVDHLARDKSKSKSRGLLDWFEF